MKSELLYILYKVELAKKLYKQNELILHNNIIFQINKQRNVFSSFKFLLLQISHTQYLSQICFCWGRYPQSFYDMMVVRGKG